MKTGIKKYIRDVRIFFNIFRVVCLIGGILCLVPALSGMRSMYFAFGGIFALFVAVSIFCSTHFFLKAVIECQREGDRIVLFLEKRKYAYRVSDCRSLVEKGRRFIAVFEDETSRDSYIFYRNLPFAGYAQEYFTASELTALLDKVPEKTE